MRKLFSCAVVLLIAIFSFVLPAVLQPVTIAAAKSESSYCYLYGDPYGKYYKMKKSGWQWIYSNKDQYAVVEEKNDGIMLHPGNQGDVMRGWQSAGKGTIRVHGSISLEHAPDGTVSEINGILFTLVIKRKQESGYAAAQALDGFDKVLLNTSSGLIFDIVIEDIKMGDVILAAVNANGNNNSDGNRVSFSVDFKGSEEGEVPGDFGCAQPPIGNYFDKQGVNGWYYAYGMPQKYLLMQWGFAYGNYVWSGDNPYQFISSDTIHPYGKWSSLKIWIAGFDGVIEIDGVIERNSEEGDGTFADIYHNNERIWWEQCDYTGYKTYEIKLIRRTVKKGDAIVFSIGTGPRYDEQGDGVKVTTNIYPVSIDSAYDPNEDLSEYLSLAANEAELEGVKHINVDSVDKGCGSSFGRGVSFSLVVFIGVILLLREGRRKCI